MKSIEENKVAETFRLSFPSDGEVWQNATSTFSYFDPNRDVSKRRGTFLPHWRQEGVIYFVTFRLADSLPQEKLKVIRDEISIWRHHNPIPLTVNQKREFHSRFTSRIQDWLDSGYGSMLLKHSIANEQVHSALGYFNEDRYLLDEYVIAGNHVHVLVTPIGKHKLTQIIRSWKCFTAKKLLKLPEAKTLSTAPNVWQHESWDHIVRSEASLKKFQEYIRAHES